jgi:hypothetical protein
MSTHDRPFLREGPNRLLHTEGGNQKHDCAQLDIAVFRSKPFADDTFADESIGSKWTRSPDGIC